MNIEKVPAEELMARMHRFRCIMDTDHPEWELAVIVSKINIYYFTGTMQEGMLIIPRNEEAVLWVRRSYERALHESLFPEIRFMDSFRDAAAGLKTIPDTLFLETEIIPLAFLQRFSKHFPHTRTLSLDGQVAHIRSVKSLFELNLMRQAGQRHRLLLEEHVPHLLSFGMTEVDLAGELYRQMLKDGHHGVARFGMFDTEMAIGHIAFGESSLYPTSFNGPGGNYGLSAAVPVLGSRQRKLQKGDLVFIDIGFGFEGYHTDKTMNYVFGDKPKMHILEEHRICLDIQQKLAEKLKPGAIPSVIYEETLAALPSDFLQNFMGYGQRQVKFLGHGIGLVIDETPVIARGFDKPLEENMVLALEPKKGIKDFGMVGIENTFIVTPQGGECITGISQGLIPVK
jgi:Xaa-Pro aminopeptidase